MDDNLIDTGEAPEAPADEPAAAPKKRRKRKKRKMEQQFPVVCKGAGEHSDLAGQEGILTVDYVNGEPWEGTFDPADDSVENVVIPIYGWLTNADTIGIRSENTSWRFNLIRPPLD